jgi:nucleoside-diphosphate-sugar epimerase
MKHLVLGSSGQIGNCIVDYFKSQGEEVIEFDIERDPNEDLRISNNLFLEDKIKECDIVHFLAFDVGGAKYLEKYQDTYPFISNNIKIMANTFELIQKYNKPVLFASSQMSELGYSTYGQLKNIGEKMTKDLNGIVVRFWNVYGYEKDEEKSHVITDFVKMAKYEGVIKMRTDGTESRQFLYGDDCAEALLILSKNYDSLDKNKSYHITSFEWITVLEIAQIIQEISGCKIIPSDKKYSTQKNSMNEADNYMLNLWQPKTTLEEGINIIYKKY